jgi:chromosome partitioning protein
MAAKVIFIGLPKGGTGKTTTAENLAKRFVKMNLRVLGIDADGQASWSQLQGLFPRKDRPTIYTAIKGYIDHYETRLPLYKLPSGLYFVPSTTALHQLPTELTNVERREYVLSHLLAAVSDRFDVIVIDTPPAVNNTWTNNIYAVADAAVMTVQVEPLAISQGGHMLEQLQRLYKIGLLKPDLMISGAVLTMMDSRTVLHRNLADIAREELGAHIKFFDTRIERSIQFPEAQFYGQPIEAYSPGGKGAIAYEALAQEVWAGARQVRVADLKVPAGFGDHLLEAASAAEGDAGNSFELEEVYIG